MEPVRLVANTSERRQQRALRAGRQSNPMHLHVSMLAKVVWPFAEEGLFWGDRQMDIDHADKKKNRPAAAR